MLKFIFLLQYTLFQLTDKICIFLKLTHIMITGKHILTFDVTHIYDVILILIFKYVDEARLSKKIFLHLT